MLNHEEDTLSGALGVPPETLDVLQKEAEDIIERLALLYKETDNPDEVMREIISLDLKPDLQSLVFMMLLKKSSRLVWAETLSRKVRI